MAATAILSVEVVLLAVIDRQLSVLLVDAGRRFPGRRALPGGPVQDQERLDAAAQRILVGAGAGQAHLEQLRTHGEPGRDPRGRVAAIAYLGLTSSPRVRRGSGAVSWVPVTEADDPPLALDHPAILADGVERARSKLEYTSLAAALVTEPFRLADLRHVYEAVWGAQLDPGNFRRKVMSTTGFVEPIGDVAPPGPEGGRPARLYRRGASRLLHPAMLRPSAR